MKMREARKGFKMVIGKVIRHTYFGKMPKIRYESHLVRNTRGKK